MHLVGLGGKYFSTLRSAAARCMVQGQGQPNPYLAVTVLSRHSQDPVMHVFLTALRCARDALIWMSPEAQSQFFHAASRHPATSKHVHGPAGALAYYAAFLDVKLDACGHLVRTAMSTIHLLQDPWPQILQWANQAWAYKLPSLLSSRKAWHALPAIDFRQQHRLFQTLTSKQRMVLAKDLTGAFLVNSRKQKFDDAQSELCAHCGQLDSVSHRVLECPKFQAVRSDHAEAVEFLTDFDPMYVELPICFLGGDHEINEWRQRDTAEFHWTDNSPAEATDMFFIDGSCKFPELWNARSAAYSVVKARLMEDGNFAFAVVGTAECSGAQSIGRAELEAILHVTLNAIEGCVYSDSQYALDVVATCQATPDVRALHKSANFDLTFRLWHSLQQSRLRFAKVKAHRDLHQAISTQDAIEIHGNAIADTAAKAAGNTYRSLNMRYADPEVEIDMMRKLVATWRYRYDLIKQRAALDQAFEDTTKPHPPGEAPAHMVHRLQQYHPHRIEQITLHIHPDFITWSLWGTSYSSSVYDWMKKLSWPAEGHETDETCVGATWLELTLSYIMDQGRLPRINLGGSGKRMRLVTLALDAPPMTADMSFLRVTNQFRRCVEHLLKNAETIPPQWNIRSKLNTHYLFGARCGAQGLKNRPCYPHQQWVIQLLQKYFREADQKCTWHEWPIFLNVPLQIPAAAEEDELAQSYRFQRYRSLLIQAH